MSKIDDEAELPNEGACSKCMMNRGPFGRVAAGRA